MVSLKNLIKFVSHPVDAFKDNQQLSKRQRKRHRKKSKKKQRSCSENPLTTVVEADQSHASQQRLKNPEVHQLKTQVNLPNKDVYESNGQSVEFPCYDDFRFTQFNRPNRSGSDSAIYKQTDPPRPGLLRKYSSEPARINVTGNSNDGKADTAFTTGVDNGSTTVNVNTYVNGKTEQKERENQELEKEPSKFAMGELFRLFHLICFSFVATFAVAQNFDPWTFMVTIALSFTVYQYRGANTQSKAFK